MAKNEIGVPIVNSSVLAANSTPDGNMPAEKPEHHSGCGGRGDCLDAMPLAYVYAPDQQFRLLYSAKDALSHGTLFEELFKSKEVYGREH